MGNIVVSGVGIVSNLGIDLDSHFNTLMSSGYKKRENGTGIFRDLVRQAGEVDIKKYIKNKKSSRFFSKQTKYGCYCARKAMEDANLTEEDIQMNETMNALILGSGYSQSLIPMADALIPCVEEQQQRLDYEELGNKGYRMLAPLWILSRLPNTTAGQVSIENGIKGLNYTVVNGVNSGIVSIGEAFHTIKQERAVRVVCGGIEDEILPDFVYELKKDRLISDTISENKVFGKNSNGYSIGEGGCVLIVEKEEEALKRCIKPYAEIIGYSNYYIPDLSKQESVDTISKHLEKNMRKCLDMAQIEPSKIDFVQSSAGGYKLLDYSEAIAINNIFLDSAYVTESKSYVGNTLSASGAISTAFACLQLKNDFIAPILEKEDIFLDGELKYVKDTSIKNESKICMINSFSHLGEMCTLILRKR